MKDAFSTFLSWISTLLFLLLGFFYYSTTYSVLVFFVTLLAVLVCAPPSRRFFTARTGVTLSGGAMALATFVLFIAQGWIGIAQNFEVAEGEHVQREQDKVQALESARAGEWARFLEAKPGLVAKATAMRDQGKLAEALALIAQANARMKDRDLDELRTSILIIQTEAGLKDEAALPLRQRLALYTRLAALDPANARFAAKVAALDAQLKESSAREQAETERFSQAHGREAMLARQFDKRSGAHRKLQAEIKRTMMNPASYQHVETTNLDTGSGMSVWTTFRGKNAAGKMVENSLSATVDDSGNVLTIEE
ncbi:hypothetical protein INH39_18180 [Massilia violaceinigra]|uniref:Uncharacterized protein n=1 Tax=Massilia violaceinigra TaxID=2045208 RepID=A0ABY3ZYA4_9BURK|nr:hypothetical protein [Massilia violaceinigra]UOD27453.1 hypothetical protein INH39_18180 [Massilia violaceinigra]